MFFGFDNGAQTCNVFWSYIYFLNRGICNGEKFIIPIHERTIGDYPGLLQCQWLKFPFYSSLSFLGDRICRSVPYHMFKNKLVDYHRLCQQYPKYFINGYDFRYTEIDEQAKTIIRSLFIPASHISVPVEYLMLETKKKYDIIVGMHIRRGDYATWEGGIYFYSFELYASVCREIINQFPNERVIFMIASNEQVPDNSFVGIDYFQTPQSTPTQDLYALSLCDYIIGPISTFSRFAAFRGDVPIAFITNSNGDITQFRKLKSMSRYMKDEYVYGDFCLK